jgi:methionyl-tRNA synthetase
MGLAANISALISILLWPYMPQTCETLQKQLNFKINLLPKKNVFHCFLKSGHKIGKVCIFINTVLKSIAF